MDFSPYTQFVETLLTVNQNINLVSRDITQDEFYTKHIFDSVKIVDFFDFSGSHTLLDIGSGGGIPGIPLGIANPHLQITLLDSVQKKMKAAKQIADSLSLANVSTLSDRFEEVARDPNYRESFDIVTARAVSALPTLLEYALPFVKVGGYFIAYKGKNYKEELADAQNALKVFGINSHDIQIHTYTLPNDAGDRAYLVFHKTSPTPNKYPRQTGMPKKKPL